MLCLLQATLLKGSHLHEAGMDILSAAERSIDELQPVIERGEADQRIEQVCLYISKNFFSEIFCCRQVVVIVPLTLNDKVWSAERMHCSSHWQWYYSIMQGALSKPHLYWAFSILLSRLVRLPTLRNVEALCPWADMINHDCRATSHLDFDLASQTASLISDRSYSPGEQVEVPASNNF